MVLDENITLRQHANNAIRIFSLLNTTNSQPHIENASVYGIALKYILFNNRLSIALASRILGYKSSQAFNYVLNCRKEESFYREEITFFCKKLNINEDEFLNLCREIKGVLNNGTIA